MTSPIRFGAFEVDTRSGELRRQGLRSICRSNRFRCSFCCSSAPVRL